MSFLLVKKEKEIMSQDNSFLADLLKEIHDTNISNITESIFQVIQSVKELNSIKTSIQTISGISDLEVNSMMKSYNDMAKQLSLTTKEVSEAAKEFLNMGESVASTNELIKSSQVLSKTAMIESADAANYLISVMKGYNIASENSMDIVSKLINIDMDAAINAGELAEAISQCADIANDSGTSIERLIGYMAAVGEVTQNSMSSVGTSFKSIYERINNIKIGKLIDDETGESLSDIENVLNELGIQLKDTKDIYRDFDDVLDDVSRNWKNFTKTEQNDISVAIVGATQKENFIALMNNYSNALRYSETATNSAGEAMERYGVYQDSLEAKCNELAATIESLSTNAISQELYGGIVKITTEIVEFLDKTNLLNASLVGLTAMGIAKIVTGMITAAKSTMQLTAAMALFDNGKSNQNLNAIGQACIGLSDSQLKLVLSSQNLQKNEQLLILTGMGLSDAQSKEKLETLGLLQAQRGAIVSTGGFIGALKGLKNILFTLVKANPVLTAIFAIGTVVSVIKGINSITNSSENLKKKIADLQKEVSDSQSTIDSTTSQLEEVKQKIKDIQSLGTLSFAEEKELEVLQNQKTELENILNIEKERHKLSQDKLEENAKKYVDEKKTSRYKEETFTQKEIRNDMVVDVTHTKAAEVNKIEEIQYAAKEMLKQQENIDKLNSNYSKIKKPTEDETKEYEAKLKEATKARNDARTYALELQGEVQEKVTGLSESSETYQMYLEASTDLSDALALINGDVTTLSVKGKKSYIKKNTFLGNLDIQKEFNEFLDTLNEEELQLIITNSDILSPTDKGIYENYQNIMQQVEDKGIDLDKTVYGNIDTNNRKALDWTDEMIKQYRKALESWDEDNAAALSNNNSSIWGISAGFDGVEIAFSPILQTENGTVLLEQGTVSEYIWGLINKACEDDDNWNKEEILKLDMQGLNINGQQIKGIIADVGNTAVQSSDALNYTGELGLVDKTLKECDKATNSLGQSTRKWMKSFTDEDDVIAAIKLGITSVQELINENRKQVKELDPSDFLKSSQDKKKTATLVDLQEEADLLSSLSDELSKTGKIGTASMQSIIEKYPEAKEYLGDYMLGVVSEAELFLKLQEVYAQDELSYKISLLEKAKSDETFYQTLVANNQELFTELSNFYETNFYQYKNLAQAKAEIDKELVQELAGIWGEYYDVKLDETTGLYEVKKKDEDRVLTAEEEMALGREQMVTGDLEVDKIRKLEEIRDRYNRVQKIALDQIDVNIDTSWPGLSGFDSSSLDSAGSLEQNTSKDYDLIERAIQKLEREISNLDTIIDNTYDTWSTRNSALFAQIDKIKEEIDTQQAAYQYYMDLANDVGLDSHYQDLIKNGDIDIITIEDKELQDQIDTFQNFYDKALSAQDSVSKLQSQLNELDKTKFDNIIKQFEIIEDGISHTVSMIDKRLKLIEEKGFFANSSIYEKLIEQHKAQLQILNDKREQLTDALNGSDIQEGTQAWDELKQQINNVNEAILDTIISIEQFSNELNRNEFAKFDYFQDKINSLTEESDFYTSLIEAMGKKLVDENGSYTNEGWTTAGLHAQNFNTYLKQAEEYANMIDKLNKQLADDSNNTVLLEQKQEYIKAQRDSILSAQDEREAIINLIKDGYDKQLDSLGKVIDKYKDLLSSIKEANDYEKNIREQTENLANLNKQYLAVLGDDSEGNRKNIQQLENDIREAQEELQETQYEKLISDTEKLLDDLQADYEELMNQRLDNIDAELINIYSGINENANSIKDTLSQLSTDSDMLLSEEIRDIWNNSQPIIDLNSSVDTVNESISGTNTAIDNLRYTVEAILNKMDMIINEQIGQAEITDSDNTITSTTESSNNTDNYNTNDSSDSSSNTRSVDWWIEKKDYYPKDELNIETSIVDRLKWHDYDSSKEVRAIYYEMMGLGSSDEYYGSAEQNIAMLSWMKEKGYADGSRYITKRQIAFTQENGSEMIYDKSTGSMLTPVSMAQFIRSLRQKSGMLTYLETGDKVFTNNMSENLWKIARNPYDFGVDIKPDFNYDIPVAVTGSANNHVKIDFGDVQVTLPNVKNYQEFMQQAQADKNFAKMIESIALGKAFGANTFDKCTFR